MPLHSAELQIISSIAHRRDALLETLSQWVSLATGHDHTPGLDAQRSAIIARLQALGATTRLVPGSHRPPWLRENTGGFGPPPPTAICTKLEPRAPRRVLLCGHIDTVHDPNGPFQRLTLSQDGTTATGPGCADMKGGILVAVAALEALAASGAPCSWTFLLNSDEETGSFCSDEALRAEARSGYHAGLIFEPALPDGSLVIERPGSGQFVVECSGKAAHVGRDFASGVSAVNELARTVLRAAALADAPNGLIVNVGPLQGGSATNIVPECARAWGNVRFSPPREADAAAGLDALNSLGDALPRVQIQHIFNRPPKPATPEVRRLAALAQECATDLGQALPLGTTGGVCDGNNMQAAGLPVIDTLGVRGGKLHTTEEFMVVASLVERAQLAAVLLRRLAGA